MTGGQLGFGFDDDAAAAAQQGTPAARPRKPKAPPPAPAPVVTALPAAPGGDAEAMARALEQHPDYRVLRRLVPATRFDHTPVGPVARVVILDTETTGLDASKDKVIELALVCVSVDLQTGQPTGPVEVYDGLQDPGMPMPKIAREITGITDAMLAGQQLDMARIDSLLAGADLVIAHNAGFDRPFVEDILSHTRELNWACSFAEIDWTAAGHSSAKLSYLASALGWFYDAHRAEMDCHALLTVLLAELPGQGVSGLAQLLAGAHTPSYRLQATGAPFAAKDLLKTRGYRWDSQGKVWHTRLGGDAALQAECEWLQEAVFAGRSAKLQWERHDAKSRYSTRAGVAGWAQLSG
ncbi:MULTISPECIES: 3'-5' exonuclease [unclassified Polaromonas]|uniref:3'-5' exonuclease n=1 Tax=unclassified Polaromonas TaxID=2638319 RepID=UPI000F079731|nr:MULTISPECIES: 3'-5' exonuclease [unclassified Polaromonas]AYQ27437.1 DNA polymerase III subunit epsilon [Polaromonas sp. SP1]QGJ20722.1 DNA polymerase III subunit epsilon [Polaromonas sp. Pch-P]